MNLLPEFAMNKRMRKENSLNKNEPQAFFIWLQIYLSNMKKKISLHRQKPGHGVSGFI